MGCMISSPFRKLFKRGKKRMEKEKKRGKGERED